MARPTITGEGFNWGYFLAPVPNSATSSPPSVFFPGYYPVPTPPVAYFIFPTESALMFNDYYQYFAQMAVGGSAVPLMQSFNMYPTTNYFRPLFLGKIVTMDDGSSLVINSDAFTTSGQDFIYITGASYVVSVSGMVPVT